MTYKLKKEIRFCVCCGKKLINPFTVTKYCSKCSLYHKNKQYNLSIFKSRFDILNLKYSHLKNKYKKLIDKQKIRKK